MYQRSIEDGVRDRVRSIAAVLKLCNLGFDLPCRATIQGSAALRDAALALLKMTWANREMA
jgi:hypothetical protein